jgi:hypothetical protein
MPNAFRALLACSWNLDDLTPLMCFFHGQSFSLDSYDAVGTAWSFSAASSILSPTRTLPVVITALTTEVSAKTVLCEIIPCGTLTWHQSDE